MIGLRHASFGNVFYVNDVSFYDQMGTSDELIATLFQFLGL
jgi:hypothetical protein